MFPFLYILPALVISCLFSPSFKKLRYNYYINKMLHWFQVYNKIQYMFILWNIYYNNYLWLFASHGLYSPWNSPGQNTGVDSLSHFQGIFPTQGSNPGLPHCRWILYQVSHKGSPRILEWVAYPFSSRSSRPRNWTGVFWIAGGFFTNWAIREAHNNCS